MTKDQWRERLLGAGIPEEVVAATLEGMKDEDFARMKDMSPEQLLAELTKAELVQDKDQADASADTEADEGDVSDDLVDITEAFEALKDDLLAQVKDLMSQQEVELEVPALGGVVSDLEQVKADVSVIKDALDKLVESDEERLLALAKDMSPASKARLVVHTKSETTTDDAAIMAAALQKWFGEQAKDGPTGPLQPGGSAVAFKPIIRDASGNEYENLGGMIVKTPGD